MLICLPIPTFSTPLSSLLIVLNLLNYRLPQNRALMVPKLAPTPPKMGKIYIFPKLKGLECSFLFQLSIFHPTESIHNSLKHSQLSVTPKLAPRGLKIGPKPTQSGLNHHISETKTARMLIFVTIPPFSTPLSPLIIISNVPNYRLPQNWALEAPKLPKMGKITIYQKLKELECSFLFHNTPFRVTNNNWESLKLL